jgi:hypothetical protein
VSAGSATGLGGGSPGDARDADAAARLAAAVRAPGGPRWSAHRRWFVSALLMHHLVDPLLVGVVTNVARAAMGRPLDGSWFAIGFFVVYTGLPITLALALPSWFAMRAYARRVAASPALEASTARMLAGCVRVAATAWVVPAAIVAIGMVVTGNATGLPALLVPLGVALVNLVVPRFLVPELARGVFPRA